MYDATKQARPVGVRATTGTICDISRLAREGEIAAAINLIRCTNTGWTCSHSLPTPDLELIIAALEPTIAADKKLLDQLQQPKAPPPPPPAAPPSKYHQAPSRAFVD